MSIFIRSSASISAQHSFGFDSLLSVAPEQTERRLRVIEPDYAAFIDHKSLRRMSHLIKMGVTAAKQCLTRAGLAVPDAIVVGTAYGSMELSSAFELSIIDRHEDDLSPTIFMQSTHNTVAAQIALMIKCHGHNNSFVHKGFSFESALQDAVMLLIDNDAASVLAGGIDEMTDTSFTILSRLGLYKRHPGSNLDIFKSDSKGTIGGEGAAFFLLLRDASPDNLAKLTGVKMFYKPADGNEIEQQIENFMAANSLGIQDVDLVITGKNGDSKSDRLYDNLATGIFSRTARAVYKHLCGEYPTSTSFALWLAAGIIKSGMVPEVIKDGSSQARPPKRVLIHNCYLGIFHSLILLEAIGDKD